MEEAFIALLQANSAVGEIFAGRIDWNLGDQGENGKPYCILRRVGGDRDYHSKGDSGLVFSRVQIDVFAGTYEAAKTGKRRIVSAISGFRGETSGIQFQGIFLTGERDFVEEDNDANNQLQRVSVDAMIWHREN